MMKQTRNALIYSDLALFVLDTRDGINFNDVAMYKWLNFHKLKLPNELREQNKLFNTMTEEEKYQMILNKEAKFTKVKGSDAVVDLDQPRDVQYEIDFKGLQRE